MATETYIVPDDLAPADRFPIAVADVGREFMRLLFTPDRLEEVTDPAFVEWEHAVTPDESRITLNGLAELVAYRQNLGREVDGQHVLPELYHYDQIAVPATQTWEIPGTGGRHYNFGTVFKSWFKLPGADELPPANLLMREEMLIEPNENGMLVVKARTYMPYDEFGRPIGPGTDRPDITQHTMVGRQIEGHQPGHEPLVIAGVEDAYRHTFPDVEFDNPTLPLRKRR